MAARRARTTRSERVEEVLPEVKIENETASETRMNSNFTDGLSQVKKNRKIPVWVWVLVVVLVAVLGWWYKTNTWPVVAMVGSKPITRYEVDQLLFKQNGQTVIEGLITQRVIEEQLEREKVYVDKSAVEGRVDELRKAIPEGRKLEDEVVAKGMSMDQIRKLIELDLRLNKAVSSNIAVASDEIDKYIKDNGDYLTGKTDAEKRTEAESLIKSDKQQAEIDKWVTVAKEKISVWRLIPQPTPQVSP